MLYRLTQKDVREDNDNIDIVPEFADLSSRELKFICLVYDYETPLWQLNLEDRTEKAAEMAGYKRESAKRMDKDARAVMGGKIKRVEAAIPVFRSMQRDIDRETLMAFDSQIEQFIAKTSEKKVENKDWDVAMKILKELPKLLAMRKEIKDMLTLRVDLDPTLGVEKNTEDDDLSTLDKYNARRIEEATS